MSANTEIQRYIDDYKNIQTSFLEFLEDSSDDPNQIDFIDIQRFQNDKEEFNHLLRLILNIFNYHRRDSKIIDRTEQVLQFLADSIKQTYSKIEIFDIFKSNKLILLLLIKNKITTFDKSSVNYMKEEDYLNNKNYCHFFYPEIEDFLDAEHKKVLDEQRSEFTQNMIDNFEQLRLKGENSNYIATLIRNDSVEDFISHVNHFSISLDSTLSPSIFETDPFLLDHDMTLIEYAAFYGCIQIFQYLQMNHVELSPLLWACAVHSKNAELFHKLKSDDVEPNDEKFNECYIESIKCHYIDFTHFIQDNLLNENGHYNDNAISEIINSSNYYLFPSSFDDNASFYSLCLNNYNKLIDITIKANSKSIERFIKFRPVCVLDAFTLYTYITFSKGTEILTENLILMCLDNLVEMAIPPSITTIKNNIFNRFKSLKKVTMTSSVTSFDDNAFRECVNLNSINIPSSVNKIGKYAFSGCSSLIQISLPPSIKSIEFHTFQMCRSLTQISIPFSVTSIGRSAFYGCSNLKKVFIPNSVTSIGPYAFFCCSNLQKVDIPSSVTSIKFYAFSDCVSLTDVHLPSSIDLIDEYTFNNCALLNKIVIPSSVKLIDLYAFFECVALEEIDFQENSSVQSFEYMSFYGCSALKKVSFPSSVTAIGGSSFRKCANLAEVTFGKSVQFIGSYAFSECPHLNNVEIPPSVSYVGIELFDDQPS